MCYPYLPPPSCNRIRTRPPCSPPNLPVARIFRTPRPPTLLLLLFCVAVVDDVGEEITVRRMDTNIVLVDAGRYVYPIKTCWAYLAR